MLDLVQKLNNISEPKNKNKSRKRVQSNKPKSVKVAKHHNVPWRGWAKEAPKGKQLDRMYKRCGKDCFLGKKKTFPICKKGTCKKSRKGVYAAYLRARQQGSVYKNIAKKASKMLRKRTIRRR